MNYQEALLWMNERQQFTIKLGLATTETLLDRFGSPEKKFRIIHIAGTNGKGSVGATLLAVLSAAGYRTGFYSSPHLSDFRERFRLNNTFISAERCAELITALAEELPDGMQPTYFECATLLALLWFAEEQADVVILETGMGGRLDATNVVTPLLSIITDISLDHEQYLGSTIAAVAAEKAGIIKPGVPAIFSGRDHNALSVIQQRCRQQNSPLYLYGRHFSGTRSGEQTFHYHALAGQTHSDLPLQLRGEHQVVNTCLALAALELLCQNLPTRPDQWRTGLRQVNWPGRLERFSIPSS
ncbi:MAG: bifunctional folylpolyglutamate synthase/dihydrofolate synthase, partial [Desulfobulbus sp.]|nr:bifunctional folylpolyglutamate synthase/dihydrofolate synthase [Desulfobulbus sp.]